MFKLINTVHGLSAPIHIIICVNLYINTGKEEIAKYYFSPSAHLKDYNATVNESNFKM